MTVTTLGKSKLKITLSRLEASKLFGNGEHTACRDRGTQYILRVILAKALTKACFTLDCERLFVEMFPSASGGRIIFFTKSSLLAPLKQTSASLYYYLLEFTDINPASQICRLVFKQKELLVKSSLYKFRKKYYLALLSKSPYLVSATTAEEFADRCIRSKTAFAIVSEHGKKLIDDNAVDIIRGL